MSKTNIEQLIEFVKDIEAMPSSKEKTLLLKQYQNKMENIFVNNIFDNAKLAEIIGFEKATITFWNAIEQIHGLEKKDKRKIKTLKR